MNPRSFETRDSRGCLTKTAEGPDVRTAKRLERTSKKAEHWEKRPHSGRQNLGSWSWSYVPLIVLCVHTAEAKIHTHTLIGPAVVKLQA
ncbi:hypothetical protein BDW74DRAFT_159585 [Aspergillus multicolor]|uniref:uncharacterized protein n=1 Tax=Aspergillus multicolor TaxID=41759 RepID=UPI003CCD1BF4